MFFFWQNILLFQRDVQITVKIVIWRAILLYKFENMENHIKHFVQRLDVYWVDFSEFCVVFVSEISKTWILFT